MANIFEATERDLLERKKAVLAMEYLAKQVNDEEVFESWLTLGVADGDINYGSFDVCEVDDYYVEDENFKELMSVFLRLMKNAWKSGGLFCGKVVSEDVSDYKKRLAEEESLLRERLYPTEEAQTKESD